MPRQNVLIDAGLTPRSYDLMGDGEPGRVYDEEVFHYFLAIERKRSERSHSSFSLLLVELKKEAGVRKRIARDVADRLFPGLWLCLRETDFVGWYREGWVAGAVLTQLAHTPAPDFTRQLSQRPSRVLRALLPDVADFLQVSSYQFPAHADVLSEPLSFIPSSSRARTGNRRRDQPSVSRGFDVRSDRLRFINEDLFKGALIRDRQRADRSDQSFVLLLVMLEEKSGADSLWIWEPIIEALTAAKRETDVLGWFDRGSVIGVILTEIRGSVAASIRGIDARVRQEIVKRLRAEMVDGVSIRFHAHPELGSSKGESSPVDKLLPELSSRQDRAKAYDTIKRGLDVIGSLMLLGTLSPLFLVIAVLVKLNSPGPVLFRQTRLRETLKPFAMLKFRTMYANAGDTPHQEYVSWFIKSSDEAKDRDKARQHFKLTEDPRVTPIGRLLRKTSLDELPQLWNVLRGDMSLVGPRPPLPYEVEHYKRWHYRRVLEAKPGITGLWQVAGRSRTTFEEMVRLDIRYARTRSLRRDLKILIATPAAVIGGEGAC